MGGAPVFTLAVQKAAPRLNCLSTWALPGGSHHEDPHVPPQPANAPNLQGGEDARGVVQGGGDFISEKYLFSLL